MSLYLEHFNLRELPFRITPAVAFFYRGCVRGETLEALKYAIHNGEGIMAVSGEVGTGKSMLCRVLMNELVNEVELVYIANPSLAQQDIVFHIAEELGLDVDGERHRISRNLQNHLLELHGQGRRVLVCIDEAQAMPDESLEQIRLLSNLETATDKVVQIIMFGQPELTDKLSQKHMRQLRERITSSFNLRKLNADEVSDYVNHRLRSAGMEAGQELFEASAISATAKVSQGIARRINILCDKAMLAAFADASNAVTATHVKKAAADARYKRMDEEGHEKTDPTNYLRTWLAGLAATAAVAAIAYQVTQQNILVEPEPIPASTITSAPAPPPPVATQKTAAPAPVQPATATAVRPAQQTPTSASPDLPAAAVATVDNPRWASYPPSSYLRQRLNATETLFSQAGTARQYTARVITVPRGNAIATERYLRDIARFFTIRNVMIYPAVAENEQVFVITYGIFPSEFQAELFIHELPSFFRTNKPFIQAMAVTRLEAAGNW